jgi:hypothetical protein
MVWYIGIAFLLAMMVSVIVFCAILAGDSDDFGCDEPPFGGTNA